MIRSPTKFIMYVVAQKYNCFNLYRLNVHGTTIIMTGNARMIVINLLIEEGTILGP